MRACCSGRRVWHYVGSCWGSRMNESGAQGRIANAGFLPDERCTELDGGKAVACGFVQSHGEAPPVLESTESACDDVVPFVGRTVERWRAAASGALSLPVRSLARPFGIVALMPRPASQPGWPLTCSPCLPHDPGGCSVFPCLRVGPGSPHGSSRQA